jgi:preprotein translocase subunit SecA
MDYLREGIYLRAYSQRDPLVEYQREGFDMFAAMMDGIKEESVGFLFNLQVEVDEEEEPAEEPAEVPAELQGAAAVLGDGRPVVDLAEAQSHAPQIRAKGLEPRRQPQNLSYSAPAEDGEAEVVGGTVTNAEDEFAGVGRNALCPCGSGKKFKKCHGAPGGASGHTTRAGG